MTQNTLSDEIDRSIETFREQLGYLFEPLSESNTSYMIEEHLRQFAKSIAEKTVEAVRVEKEANLGYYGYKTSEQYGKVLGRNETVHELETKASRWLGKEEV